MKATNGEYIFDIPDKDYEKGESLEVKGRRHVVTDILRNGKVVVRPVVGEYTLTKLN